MNRQPHRNAVAPDGAGPQLASSGSAGRVSAMCDAFAQREQLILVLTPEGTRKKVKKWKTGFLQIAKQANVPIIPVALDYARKVVWIGPAMYIEDDIEHELARVQHFTGQAQGKIARNG